jgi:hypothetical protein
MRIGSFGFLLSGLLQKEIQCADLLDSVRQPHLFLVRTSRRALGSPLGPILIESANPDRHCDSPEERCLCEKEHVAATKDDAAMNAQFTYALTSKSNARSGVLVLSPANRTLPFPDCAHESRPLLLVYRTVLRLPRTLHPAPDPILL